MNCSGCGAPLELTDEKCQYCGKITPYGEKMFKERKKKEKQLELENMPAMKYASITAIAFLYVITFGYYSPYWFASRANSLNGLNSETKFPTWAAWLYLALSFAVFMLPSEYETFGLDDETGNNVLSVLMLALMIFSVCLSLIARKILRQYASSFSGRDIAVQSIAPSIIMILICGPVYVQFHVNKLIKSKLLAPKI